MEQERLYLEALQTEATYRVEGPTLELRTADDVLPFISDAITPVLTRGAPSDGVNIAVINVAR